MIDEYIVNFLIIYNSIKILYNLIEILLLYYIINLIIVKYYMILD